MDTSTPSSTALAVLVAALTPTQRRLLQIAMVEHLECVDRLRSATVGTLLEAEGEAICAAAEARAVVLLGLL